MSRLAGVARSLVRVVRRTPLTIAMVALVWAYGLATRSLPAGPNPRLLDRVGTGVGPLAEGRWWTPLSATLWWGTIGAAVATTAVVLLGGALAEHRIGAARTAAVMAGTQVLGTLLAVGLIAADAGLGGGWADRPLRAGRRGGRARRDRADPRRQQHADCTVAAPAAPARARGAGDARGVLGRAAGRDDAVRRAGRARGRTAATR